jgi:peptidoglycan/LPS O-acetylase OafA/YrhL
MPQQHDFTRPNLKGAVNNIDTETSPRTDYLDGWRGFNTLRAPGHFIALPIPVDLGRFGVCMFFALSGMLMSNLLFIERQPLSKF